MVKNPPPPLERATSPTSTCATNPPTEARTAVQKVQRSTEITCIQPTFPGGHTTVDQGMTSTHIEVCENSTSSISETSAEELRSARPRPSPRRPRDPRPPRRGADLRLAATVV